MTTLSNENSVLVVLAVFQVVFFLLLSARLSRAANAQRRAFQVLLARLELMQETLARLAPPAACPAPDSDTEPEAEAPAPEPEPAPGAPAPEPAPESGRALETETAVE